MKKTLAVVITYHDEKGWLTFCLESLLAQTEPVDEIWIHDDASKFPARDFLPEKNTSHPPIRILRSETVRGPSRGRNLLWRATPCDYVHFHDADDWFHPHWAAEVRRSMVKGFKAIFTEVNSFRENGELFRERVLELHEIAPSDPDSLTEFCLRHSMLVPAGTFRREVLEKLGGYREDLWQSEDYDFHIRLAALNPSFLICGQPLVFIRLRAASRSQNFVEVWSSRLQALARLASELPPQFRPHLADALRQAGSQLFRFKERALAKEAFRLAKTLGASSFAGQLPAYRVVAQRLGPETAEWLGLAYRNLLPEPVRRRIRRR